MATLLGNVLYQYASWRWIFYIGIIVEAIAFGGTWIFYRPNPRPRGDFDKSRWQELKEIDWTGLFLLTAGLTTLLIGLTWAGQPAHPWKGASTIAPIVIGAVVTIGAFAYDFTIAKNPMFPLSLFMLFRQFTLLLIIVFISGMSFYAMVPLIPQGLLYLFTTDGVKIGVYSLPLTIATMIYGVIIPALAHKIGYIKWIVVVLLAIQASFTAAIAAGCTPNHLGMWIWLPAIGVPSFTGITILSYTIAGLHIPHSQLGVATGLVGTFRAAGGAVGNAIYNTVLTNRFNTFVGEEIVPVILGNGLSPADIPKIIPAAIEYNLGIPKTFEGIQGITPDIITALQTAVRTAYGNAFAIVFLASLGATLLGFICGFFVEDPTPYMTNHVQSAMHEKPGDHELGLEKNTRQQKPTTKDNMEKTASSHIENSS